MAIEFVCPSCGGTLQVGDDAAGRVIRCGGCMAELRVPTAGGTATAASRDPYDVDRPAVTPGAARSTDRGSVPTDPTRRSDSERPSDRPRRRRPPPPPDRGVFFWLVIIGAVMLVGMVVCCGGFFLLVPGTQWRQHESTEGGFKVQLPSRSRPDIAEVVQIDMGKGAKAEGAILLKRGARFVVFYRDVPPAKDRPKLETDERLIDNEIKTLLTAAKGKRVVGEKPRQVTVGGFEGREIEFTAETGHHTVRVIVADTRVYVLMAGGGTVQPGDEDVRKFIDSFEITNRELKAEGQRRAKKKADADAEVKDRDDPPKPAPISDADRARAAEAIASAAMSVVREEIEAQERERRIRTAAEAADVRSAAATVAAVALNTALRDARPQLPVAPPPRPAE